jgi:hypothetical protein
MESIRQILTETGYSTVDELPINEPIEIPGGEAILPLTIEKIDDQRLSVAHYREQRGDLMRDPEVVFDTSSEEWVPVEYQQDPLLYQQDDSGLPIHSFLDTWNENIRSQGFINRASEATNE